MGTHSHPCKDPSPGSPPLGPGRNCKRPGLGAGGGGTGRAGTGWAEGRGRAACARWRRGAKSARGTEGVGGEPSNGAGKVSFAGFVATSRRSGTVRYRMGSEPCHRVSARWTNALLDTYAVSNGAFVSATLHEPGGRYIPPRSAPCGPPPVVRLRAPPASLRPPRSAPFGPPPAARPLRPSPMTRSSRSDRRDPTRPPAPHPGEAMPRMRLTTRDSPRKRTAARPLSRVLHPPLGGTRPRAASRTLAGYDERPAPEPPISVVALPPGGWHSGHAGWACRDR